MVYVLNSNGQPLMPTKRHGRVKHLLKNGKAEVVKRCPFTIKLTYDSTNHTQEITLGVDAGSKVFGLSASTKAIELYAAEVILRDDISDLLTAKRQNRRSRRNRKTRYRKARFLNRVRSKNKGWLALGIEHKIQTHLKAIENVCKILPVTKIVVETASFDLQLIKALEHGTPLPQGTDYQKGELLGFANLREYCFWRDNYTCQWCRGKSKNKILHMHHHAYWKGDHTDKPSSVITLCDVCNDSKNHKQDGFLWGWKPRITRTYKDAAFMGIMRWTFYNRLKEMYPDVHMTYGYITKHVRIANGLPKEHRVDALCIAGHPSAVPVREWYLQKKVRCHNRQIHKNTILKRGIRKRNQAPYEVKGFRLFDRVKYQNKEYFIFGRRSSGFFDIRTLDGEKANKGSVSYKKLTLLETKKYYLTERRCTDCV